MEKRQTHKRLLAALAIVAQLVALTSCHSGRDIAYLSDATRDSAMTLLATYSSTIHPGDQLYITVASNTPESVIPFNQETNRAASTGRRNLSGHNVPGYLVDEQGNITFPLLGPLTVIGLTYDSLARHIEHSLITLNYVNDPTVTVKLTNFRVTVVGEVRKPQEIFVDGTRLTILEAIAICGDLTIYGQRTNVTIMREQNGQQIFGEIDLTNSDFLNSPYYYLQQNDIVYVEPNDVKKRKAYRDPNTPRYISMGVSLLSLLRNTYRIATYSSRYKN